MRERGKIKEKLWIKILVYAILVCGVIISIFPFYYMFVSATNPSSEITRMPPKLLFGSNLINNFKSLNKDIGAFRVLFNSLFIAVVYTGITLVLCSMAGYAFAKFEFKGKKLMFSFVLYTLMIPFQVLLVPLFNMMCAFNWVNSYQSVIIPTLGNVFGIFLMRQNFLSFPKSLIEAARIDGHSEFGIFFKIALPIMKPALGALAIYMFMNQWNSFMWPLIALRTKEMYTFPLALSVLKDQHVVDYGEIMIGATMAIIPIMLIFLIFQKKFVSGILGGAIKN